MLAEAHYAMQAPLPPPSKYIFNAVDLETSEPGIMHSKKGGAADATVARGDESIRPVRYERAVLPPSVAPDAAPVSTAPPAGR